MKLLKTTFKSLRTISVFIAAACALTASQTRAAETSRFDELVIWKLTDALKLDPETEQRFDQTLRSLNARKKSATEAVDAAADDLKTATTSKESERRLAHYKAAVATVQKLQISEIDEVQKLLGAKKTAEYVALKSEIVDKIKEALLDSQGGGTVGVGASRAITKVSPTPLPAPKLIEE